MSRQKGKTTPTNFRFPDDLLAAIDKRVGTDGAAKDRTAYLIDLVKKDLTIPADEKLFLQPEAQKLLDEVRLKNIPPNSRSAIINWLIIEYLSKKLS